MADIADVTAVIAAAAQRADDFASKAETYSNEAIIKSLSSVQVDGYTATAPKLRGAPPVYQANIDVSYEIRSAYADALSDFRPEFEAGLAEYLAKWFPECITTSTDNWICNTILTGGTGLPENIETMIWERARRKEQMDARRLEQEATESVAARGFSIPPGVLSGRLLQIQQDVADRSATMGRDVAIKHIEIIIDNVRFAVEQGVKIRIAVLSAVNDFMRAWMLPEELAIDRAKALTEAKTRLSDSAAAYYNAMISEAELGLRAQDISARSWDNTNSSVVNAAVSNVQLRSSVVKDIAALYGQAAAAASSSIVSVAQSSLSAISSGA